MSQNPVLEEHDPYVASSFKEYLDVIHLYMMQAALKDVDPEPILSNCIRMLSTFGLRLVSDRTDPVQWSVNLGRSSQYTNTFQSPGSETYKASDLEYLNRTGGVAGTHGRLVCTAEEAASKVSDYSNGIQVAVCEQSPEVAGL